MLSHISSAISRSLVAAFLITGLTACGSDNATGSHEVTSGNVYLRAITSVWQTHSRIDTTIVRIDSVRSDTIIDTTATGYTPVPIDILIDSANGPPSFLGMAPNTLSTGTDGPEPGKSTEGGYNSFKPGVHSFVVRQAGLTPLGHSFFTTSAGTSYLPKVNLFATPYLFVVFGLLPAQLDTNPVLVPPDRHGINIYDPVFDDRFPGLKRVLDGKTVYLPHLILHDETVFTYDHNNTGNRLFLTAGSALPDINEILQYRGTDFQKNGNGVGNTVEIGEGNTDGHYVANIVSTSDVILLQVPITLKYGEVRSLFLVNDLPPGVTQMPGDGIPANPTGYFKLINVLDNQF